MKKLVFFIVFLFSIIGCRESLTKDGIITPMRVMEVVDRTEVSHGKGGPYQRRLRYVNLKQNDTALQVNLNQYILNQFSVGNCALVEIRDDQITVLGKTEDSVCQAVIR